MILLDEIDSDESQNCIIRLFQRDRVDLNSVSAVHEQQLQNGK